MQARENTLRAYTFRKPEFIPVHASVSRACWDIPDIEYLEGLDAMMGTHPLLFPNHKPAGSREALLSAIAGKPYAPHQKAGPVYIDSWGCEWKTSVSGMTGGVIRHPLASWDALADFIPPDPETQNGWGVMNWPATLRHISDGKAHGRLTAGGLRHGFLFLTLTYLRGLDRVSFDMYDEEPRLAEILGMLESFNAFFVRRYVESGVDMMYYPEDLGTQQSLLVTPAHFRKYLAPVYHRLMEPCRQAGILVHMHSDGRIMDLADDLLDCGVQILNIQDLVNGIDNISRHLKGRVAIHLDLDRQNITVRGTPADVDDLVREAVEKLGSPEGGLAMVHGLYPGTPLPNVRALWDAMEKYSHYLN